MAYTPLAGSPDDSVLRFDESVPVEEIALSLPELEGPDADQYEIIDHKTVAKNMLRRFG